MLFDSSRVGINKIKIFKCKNWLSAALTLFNINNKGSHTGKAIKEQFDKVCSDFGIANKTFKIVADQAANVKSAFASTEEADDIVEATMNLLRRQRNSDSIKEREKRESAQQALIVDAYNKEVEAINSISGNRTAKRSREQVLEELDEITEEMSESDDESEEEAGKSFHFSDEDEEHYTVTTTPSK